MEGTPKEVFSDPDCLKYHTRLPQSTRIALELKKEGANLSEIPVTVEELSLIHIFSLFRV